jgi:hypothetical protein
LIRKLTHILVVISVIGCSQNLWTQNGLLRPRKPKFSILREPFKSNSLISTKYVYISTKRPIISDGNKIVSTYGFYDDGRVIKNAFYESNIDSLIHNRFSWDSSYRIGYYTTQGSSIKFQYFEQFGGGEYIYHEGIIKQDTIIITDKFRDRPWNILRYDTLIKSIYRMQ